MFFLYISQPHHIHSHCCPKSIPRPHWAEAKLRGVDYQSDDRNTHVRRGCPLFFSATKDEKFCCWRKSGATRRACSVLSWDKTLPMCRVTIDFTIKHGHFWEWTRVITRWVTTAYSTLCMHELVDSRPLLQMDHYTAIKFMV